MATLKRRPNIMTVNETYFKQHLNSIPQTPISIFLKGLTGVNKNPNVIREKTSS